jgi:hypothetical protein
MVPCTAAAHAFWRLLEDYYMWREGEVIRGRSSCRWPAPAPMLTHALSCAACCVAGSKSACMRPRDLGSRLFGACRAWRLWYPQQASVEVRETDRHRQLALWPSPPDEGLVSYGQNEVARAKPA